MALARPIELSAMKLEWLEALDSVAPFVESRPADEIGYSAAEQAFVDPREVADAEPHFGRPGGIGPAIAP